MSRLSAHILDCYVDGEGLLEARLYGSLPLTRAAGPETSRGELMRYLAELIRAPHAKHHNPALSCVKLMRPLLRSPRQAQAARRGYGSFSRMVTLLASKPTTVRAQLDTALCRPGGKDAAAITASLKAAAFRPGPR